MLGVFYMYSSIDGKKLKGLIGLVNIIDVRESYLYKLGNVPTSKNIPVNMICSNYKSLFNHEDTYYIYCSYGFSSAKVCNYLSNMGYKVVNVIGGYSGFLNS